MVIDLTAEDSESETRSEPRPSKMPRLQSRIDHDDDDDDKLLNDFLQSKKRKSPQLENGRRIEVVISSSSTRTSSEADSRTTSQNFKSERSPASEHSIRVHTGLSDFYHVNDDEKRIEKSSYAKIKSKPEAKRLPSTSSHQPAGLKVESLATKRLHAMYMQKLSSIKGPPVELDIGSQKLSIDSNFQFVNEYKIREGVTTADPEFSVHCTCEGVCHFDTCECIVDEENDDEPEGRIVQYVRGPKGLRVLDSSFLKRKYALISECSSKCPCPASCFNRVVQHGRTVRLEIFNTEGHKRGFGLRSPEPIYAGQFIDCYLGEIIGDDEAELREELANKRNEASYLFSLDWFQENNETMNVVDGKKFGGVTRFMNHSCSPNCRLFPATMNHGDTHIYDLAFFAIRDIPPMTELTFDYNPHWERPRGGRIDPDAVKCLCGEPNCRGQLWPNNRKKNR